MFFFKLLCTVLRNKLYIHTTAGVGSLIQEAGQVSYKNSLACLIQKNKLISGHDLHKIVLITIQE